MKDQFKEEDVEDNTDDTEVTDSTNTIRGKITERLKEKMQGITDFLKNTVGAAFKGIASTIGGGLSTAGGFLAGKLGSTVIGKAFSGAKGLLSKLGSKISERKGKGSKVIGKIIGAGSDVIEDLGEYGDATPVYVVGGKLDISGGGGAGDIVSDILGGNDDDGGITDVITDEVTDKVEEKVGGKLIKKFAGSKLGKKLGGTKIGGKILSKLGGEAIESAAGAAKGAGMFSKIKGVFTSMKGAKNLSGVISAVKGAAGAGSAAAGAAGAGAAGAGLLATAGALVGPLAVAWLTDRAFKGIGGWFSAGENFGTDNPTLGMKASSALGTFLDGILPGDQSSWIQGIYDKGCKIGDAVKGFVGKAKDTVSSLWSYGKDKLMNKVTDETTDPDKLQGGLLQGNSSILSSLLAVTSPITALTYQQLRNYKNYKSKEADLEAKFLSKLTTSEREDYIANKNASLFGTMLRTQDSGKLVKTIMGTSLLAMTGTAGGGIATTELSKILESASKNSTNNSSNTDSTSNSSYNTTSTLADGDFFGTVSARYETNGGDPITDLAKSAGFISSGKGDAGGKSYGLPQFPINNGTPQKFVQWLKSTNNSLSSYFSSGFSDENWKKCANEKASEFATAQMVYGASIDYLPFNRWSKKNHNIDWNRSRAMQEYGYAMATAGPAMAQSCTKNSGVNSSMDDKTLLTKVNNYRIAHLSSFYRSSPAFINGWAKFLPKILNDCLAFGNAPAVDLSQ